MKQASIVLAVVLALLVGGSVESAETPERFLSLNLSYNVPTPAPEGRASCEFSIGLTKRPEDTFELSVEVFASSGEAQIPELGIADVFQPGCPIFSGPSAKRLRLGLDTTVFFLPLTLEVHAHPGDNCAVGGLASGLVGVSVQTIFTLSPGLVERRVTPIICEAK